MFRNSSVGIRLALGFIVMVAAMLAMAIFGMTQMKHIN